MGYLVAKIKQSVGGEKVGCSRCFVVELGMRLKIGFGKEERVVKVKVLYLFPCPA